MQKPGRQSRAALPQSQGIAKEPETLPQDTKPRKIPNFNLQYMNLHTQEFMCTQTHANAPQTHTQAKTNCTPVA